MKKIVLIIAVTVFAGCSLKPVPVVKQDPAVNYGDFGYADKSEEGSLWQGDNSGLFADGQAHKKGDTIIIDIVENTSSNTSAATSLTKETDVSAGIPNAFGVMSHLTGMYPRMNAANLLTANTVNDYDGSGKSSRTSSVQASLGARVVNVLPNGDLVISGRKDVKINNETQIIRLSGVVRPKDIGADNRVESSYLSNADIEISGSGVIADKQKPGWMARVLDKVWPF
ncbi:MAG: flagellar basal body L-ring protein FlgH [Desulfobacteraceae bacterium]|nr:flagellar basal body L-ring protein FlgH [Desulfobacteraceae bacterium]